MDARSRRRLLNVIIREMRDGCNDCRDCGGLCVTHQREACALILNPRAELRKRGEVPPEGETAGEG